MGLDMFLSTNSKKVCKAANEAGGGDALEFASGTAIYWRKANAIHKWFVDNVANGDDDGHIHWVEVEHLEKLRDTLKDVLDSHSKAPELLPTCEGFFFGGTEYDEHYFHELERTVNAIDAILENVEKFEYAITADFTWPGWREKGEKDDWPVSFTYQASW